MNDMTVTLSRDHMQIIVNHLNEGAHRVVRPVIDALMQQITPQQTQPPKDPE